MPVRSSVTIASVIADCLQRVVHGHGRCAAAWAVATMVGLAVHAAPTSLANPYGEVLALPGSPNVADPSVIRVGDRYYLYPSSEGPGVQCWSSPDMETWVAEGAVWLPAEPGGWNDADIWAPDVYQHTDGQFYLYYTANGAIGVARSDSPTGPFEDVYDRPFVGLLNGGVVGFSIDAHVFRDARDGEMYIYATTYVPTSCIQVRRMSSPTTLAGNWQIVLCPEILNWEGVIVEAPWMVQRGDRYYLMYSGNNAPTVDYAIGVAVSDSPMGPFRKYRGNPLLDTDWNFDIWGPGHNSVVTDPAGQGWLFYHTKRTTGWSWDREIRRIPIAR